MHSDPATYILGASVLCFCIGFMAACTICARRIKTANLDGFREAVDLYERRLREDRRVQQ